MLQILSLQEAHEEDERLAAELAAKSPPPPIQDDNVELFMVRSCILILFSFAAPTSQRFQLVLLVC